MIHPIVLVFFTTLGLCLLYWRRFRRSIAYLPGPPAGSWLVGNIPSFQRPEDAAQADIEWTERYGTAFRYKGCFGEDILYISDPKGMQYILNTSGYNFPKPLELRVRQRLTTGRGIVFADGTQHARHRRVMNPSFSHSALKGFLPLFFDVSRRMATKWRTDFEKRETDVFIIDVHGSLARITLDAIGEAAFGYKFNSVEEIEPRTEFHKVYHNLIPEVGYMISDSSIMFRRVVWGYMPLWLSDILTSLPKKDMKRYNGYMRVARRVAKDLVEKQVDDNLKGKEGGKDVMSILIRANHAEDPKRRLEEDELISQITTLLLAGHETTANSLSWTLYELSKHPREQAKLREEVKNVRAAVASRGESDFTISDLDSMQYMIAVMKETLRYHPILVQLSRQAGHDDVIPLEMPQETTTGDKITNIPVRQGQAVTIGLASYNRLKSVWGNDADEWRPERFLEELPNGRDKTKLGVFGNLSTFSSGLRSCIGWRFSLLEMQAVLIELIDMYDFKPAPDVTIKRAFCSIMQSMIKGQEEKGTQLPLAVSLVSKQDGGKD